MNIILIRLKQLFIPIDSFKTNILFSISLVVIWSLLSEFLKFNDLVFYNAFNLRIFFSNIIFSLIVIIFFRSIALSVIIFYTFIFLPFILYYFLRKGFLFRDLRNLDELIYALGDITSYFIITIILIFLIFTFIINIRFFKINIFILQIFIIILISSSHIYPKFYENLFFPEKPYVEDFNVSAAFRFNGPVDAFFFNYLDTLLFEKKLMLDNKIMNYEDFRSFNLSKNNNYRNIHIILMESFIDPIDFNNIKISEDIIPKMWTKLNSQNVLYGISPVSGGGSAQAEFEILCGVPSILEYGTEFNRIGDGNTNCLPNYLKTYGYKTIASQPMYGSFFNIDKAYKSLGFEKSFLTPNFDMTDMNNGWLSDRSFFKQHFELISKSLVDDKPILNYLFAVGCHSGLGQSQSYERLIEYPKSKILEEFLNCNTKSLQHLIKYIYKIKSLDPDSLIIILPDHIPPGIPADSYINAGYSCDISKKFICERKVKIIFIDNNLDIDIKKKNYSYYEIPEIIINQISNKELCKTIKCSFLSKNININGVIVDRENLTPISNQSLSLYHKELYLSLLRESQVKLDD